jgi:F0F1-type ATP synthase membrane subunit b/b'
MPKVKEPTTQYSATRQTQSAELLFQEIQQLPEETIVQAMNYIRSLTNKKKNSVDNISAEIQTLSQKETAHLEKEFVNYKKLYPREK